MSTAQRSGARVAPAPVTLSGVDADRFRDRWRDVAAWLDASPSELAGLVVLTTGALAVVVALWWGARPVASPTTGQAPTATEVATTGAGALVGADTVTVHVAGAVGAPGLVELSIGSRVSDAVAAAGGLTLDGDPEGLNLARELVDGERIDVPRVGDPSGAAPGPAGADGAAGGVDGAVDLNRATTVQLEELPGVGPVLASRIVEHREANGPFTEVGQLRDVAGIGEKTFQSLTDLVDV